MNRIIIGLIAFSMTFSTHAGVIGDELEKLGASFSENFASSDPGKFVSKSRSGYSGGTLRKRIPQTSITPISITPPSITTGGCSGIDFHFGSFSFVNGDQIRQLLSSYVQGAVGVAFSMAIEQGCPVCKSAMDGMSRLANAANQMNLDSCQMAKSTVNAMLDKKSQACASNATDDGVSADRSESQQIGGACGSDKSPLEIAEQLKDQLTCDSGDPDKDKKCEDKKKQFLNEHGNVVIYYLKEIGVLSKDGDWGNTDMWKASLYVSIMGSTIDGDYFKPTLKATDFLEAALCGTDPIQAPETNDGEVERAVVNEVSQHCADFLSRVNSNDQPLKVLYCGDMECRFDTDKNNGSAETVNFKKFIDDYQNLVGSGFPFSKQGLIRTIGDAIISMQTKAANGGPAFDAYEQYLLSTAPFPLYRLINLSAFYPDAASEILGKNTNLLAFEFARGMSDSFFENVLFSTTVLNGSSEGAMMTPAELYNKIQERAKQFTYDATEYATKDDAAYRMNTLVFQQILNLEKSLLQANLNRGLNGLGL